MSEKKAEHSPLPWDIEGALNIVAPFEPNEEEGGELWRHRIAQCLPFPNGEADAEFICRAVNYHARLVGALAMLVSNYNLGEVSYEHIQAAEDVLAKIKAS